MKKYIKRHKLVVFVILLCISVASSVIVGTLGYKLLTDRQGELQISAENNRQETEVNFLYQTLVFNKVVTLTSSNFSTKKQLVEEQYKTNTAKIGDLSHLINKYAALFGSEWYSIKSTQYTKFANASYSERVLLSTSLDQYKQELTQDIVTTLTTKGLLTAESYQEFNNYIIIVDTRYVEFSNKFFDTNGTVPVVYGGIFDVILNNLSKSRGYTPKVLVAPSDLQKIDDTIELKKTVYPEYSKLLAAGKQAGVEFDIISSYRSVEDQKVIFSNELEKYGVVTDKLQDEVYINKTETQEKILQAFNRVAPPGYSKHHTGIAFDLVSTESRDFGATKAYQWLSRDNFYNAKRFGFLPSYPKLDEPLQYGPNPEAWEFFYVGLENTLDGK
jgi:LAS superfamily LD-carboxypeptidase LdcB